MPECFCLGAMVLEITVGDYLQPMQLGGNGQRANTGHSWVEACL